MKMVGERPLGITLLATLNIIIGIVQLTFGLLLLIIGNPLPTVIPNFDSFFFAVLFIGTGLLELIVGYYLRSGEALGWLVIVALSITDAITRILLPVAYGGVQWVFFIAFLSLDVATLSYVTTHSAMTFFGGDNIHAILGKVGVEMQPRTKEWKFTLRLVRKSSLSLIGAAIVLFYVFMALFAPILAPAGDVSQGGDSMMIPKDGVSLIPIAPNAKHPFGTTQGQYDMYYGVIWGSRSALRIGLLVAGGSLVIGLAVGILAAYYGGWMDEVLMRLTDIVLAFPGLILSMALIVVLVPAVFVQRLDAVMLSLVIVGWPGYARLIRGEILRIKNEDYVEAAKSVGCSDFRVIRSHILPNSIYPVLIVFTLDLGTIVLAAAALSFLGLGASPGYADWGQIIYLSLNWIYAKPTHLSNTGLHSLSPACSYRFSCSDGTCLEML